MAGISGTAADGVDSIVISGGYEDDRDEGAVVIYTGHGGNDPATGKQIADQELHRGNAGLAKNCDESLPVRVIRGAKLRSPYSPKYGYRYDGLYYVEKYWQEKGRSGYQVWRFRLVREDKYTGRSRK
jgi:putative restriction endonuclease